MNADKQTGTGRPRTRLAGALLLVAVVLGAAALFTIQLRTMPQEHKYLKTQPGQGSSATTQAVPTSVPPTMAGVVEPPSSGAYLGVYQPPVPFDISGMKSYAALSDKAPAIIMWYQPWAQDSPHEFDPAAVVSVYEHGAIPMITWEPWNPGKDANTLKNPQAQPRYRLANIIKGNFDSYIKKFARSVKTVRGPVMIRLMHEMNGNWYPWNGTVNGNTPEQFVVAWRHVHDIFEKEGATNVTWVWSINHESVPSGSANRYSVYYPGDRYVDWVSISGFNWGTSSPGTLWHPLDYWYAEPMAYLKSTRKPIVVSEFACVEQGGDKAAWIRDAYTRFRREYPAVKAVIYYNKREWQGGAIQDWRINTSRASREAYRDAVSSSHYLAGPPETLAQWTGSLTPENWAYLRSLSPVY